MTFYPRKMKIKQYTSMNVIIVKRSHFYWWLHTLDPASLRVCHNTWTTTGRPEDIFDEYFAANRWDIQRVDETVVLDIHTEEEYQFPMWLEKLHDKVADIGEFFKDKKITPVIVKELMRETVSW